MNETRNGEGDQGARAAGDARGRQDARGAGDAWVRRLRAAFRGQPRRSQRLPEPLEAAGFWLQEHLVWPLQDRFSLLPGANRALIGGGAGALVAVVAAVLLLSSGGGGTSSPTTTVSDVAAQPERLAAPAGAPTETSKPQKQAPRETLHGAAPVFTPPSPASKGGVKTGKSKASEGDASSSSTEASGPGESSSATSATSPPAAATISSDPKKGSKAGEGATDSSARAAVPNGPPAGPAALKVAREFAKGFVVYEVGGEALGFREAFKATATPELARALLQRPPKQPAGVKVPRAKVLNVVAGPSQGGVYKVSVALLRVGATSELRLEMERLDSGKPGKGAEWRVTNVLG